MTHSLKKLWLSEEYSPNSRKIMEQEQTYTKGDYKKLSNRIRKDSENISQRDYEMLQSLRITYKSSLALIFNSLNEVAQKIDKDSVCTYRIKRIESIISKLLRFPRMEVQRIADIAGCRCIMISLENTMKLYEYLKNEENKLPFIIQSEKNYIKHPKTNGYRSIHLNVRLKDSEKVIEIQLRCLEQHNWATLVEISDLLFNSKLKEYEGKECPELYEFHKLLAKQDNELTLFDKKRIFEISENFHYLTKLGTLFSKNHLELRKQRNNLKTRKNSFFLISTDTKGNPELSAFPSFDNAERAYFKKFTNNPENKNIVLTHFRSTTFNKISIAYSNYFLTYNETLFRILKLIADVSVYSFNNYKAGDFKKNYEAFWGIISEWFGEKLKEIDSYKSKKKKSIKKEKEWTGSILSNIHSTQEIIMNMRKEFHSNILYYPMKYIQETIEKKYLRIIKTKKTNYKQQ